MARLPLRTIVSRLVIAPIGEWLLELAALLDESVEARRPRVRRRSPQPEHAPHATEQGEWAAEPDTTEAVDEDPQDPAGEPGGPPAHWVERVRHAAPHLLKPWPPHVRAGTAPPVGVTPSSGRVQPTGALHARSRRTDPSPTQQPPSITPRSVNGGPSVDHSPTNAPPEEVAEPEVPSPGGAATAPVMAAVPAPETEAPSAVDGSVARRDRQATPPGAVSRVERQATSPRAASSVERRVHDSPGQECEDSVVVEATDASPASAALGAVPTVDELTRPEVRFSAREWPALPASQPRAAERTRPTQPANRPPGPAVRSAASVPRDFAAHGRRTVEPAGVYIDAERRTVSVARAEAPMQRAMPTAEAPTPGRLLAAPAGAGERVEVASLPVTSSDSADSTTRWAALPDERLAAASIDSGEAAGRSSTWAAGPEPSCEWHSDQPNPWPDLGNAPVASFDEGFSKAQRSHERLLRLEREQRGE